MFGVYLVLHEKTATAGATPLAWCALVAALLGITGGTLYQKRFGGGMDWRPALTVQYAAAGLLFALGAFAFETRVVHWTPQFIVAIGYLAAVLSFGGIWLFYYLIRHAAATRVTSLFYLVPPMTALMAWALFGERLPPLALAGMAICVAGVALVAAAKFGGPAASGVISSPPAAAAVHVNRVRGHERAGVRAEK